MPPCLVLEIDNKIARQAAGYYLIEKDLRDILCFLEEYTKLVFQENLEGSKILIKALTKAIAITYGKCFAEAQGRGIKLEEIIISKINKETHKKLIHMRNEYIAHAGASGHEYSKYIAAISPEKKFTRRGEYNITYFFELGQLVVLTESIDKYHDLFEELHNHVVNKIKALNSKLNKQIQSIDPNDFYKKGGYKNNRIVLDETSLKKIKDKEHKAER